MLVNIIKKITQNQKMSDVTTYSFVKYIVLSIGFIKNIVNAKFLGPEQLGVLGGLILIISYLGYADLGILYSMNREYPLAIRKSIEEGKKVLDTSFTFLLFTSAIVGCIGIPVIIYYAVTDSNYSILLGMAILAAILEQYTRYYINYFRLVDKVRFINKIELIKNVVGLILILILIIPYSNYGVIFSMIICSVIILIYSKKNSEKIIIGIDKTILKILISVGIPLLIYNLGFYILTSIDRLVILRYLTKNDMGIYTFANQIVSATLMFIASILFLYYPKAIQKLNFDNIDKKEVISYIGEYTNYIELLGISLIIIGIICIYPFINLILPNYHEAISIYNILVVGTILTMVTYLSNVCIVSNKHQNKLVVLQGISICLALFLNLVFVKIGLGLKGIAIATTLVNIIYTLVQSFLAYRLLGYHKSIIQSFKNLYRILIIIGLIIFMNLFEINYWIYASICIGFTVLLYYKSVIRVFSKFKTINN